MEIYTTMVYKHAYYSYDIYVCRGKCIDAHSVSGKVQQGDILTMPFYHGDPIDTLRNIFKLQVYAVYDAAKMRHIACYQDKYAAEQAIEGHKNYGLDILTLRCGMYYDPKEPIKTSLLKGSDGRFYCKMNLHPSRDGTRTAGKVYFPDRSWPDAAEGPCTVNVIREKDTYGFLTGVMTRFEDTSPTWDEFLDFIWDTDNSLWLGREIAVINHPVRGRYIAVCGYGEWQYLKGGYDTIVAVSDPIVEVDYSHPEYVEKELLRGSQHLIEDRFGIPFHQVYNGLSTCRFLSDIKYRNNLVGTRWESTYDTSFPDCVRGAIAQGLFSAYKLEGTNIVAIEAPDFYTERELLVYSWDEVQEIFAEASKINKAAEDNIGALIKKGRIRIQGISR